jgi:hypothetical protein
LDVTLGRADESPAALGNVTAADVVVEDAAPDALASLEHDHRMTGVDELAGGRQSGQPGADHDHVGGARRDRGACRLGSAGTGGGAERGRRARTSRAGDETAARDRGAPVF